jgi:hypothetical protein
VSSRKQFLPQAPESVRIVELVSVDADRPSLGAGKPFDWPVRLRRSSRAAYLQMIELPSKVSENLPGVVGRNMVERVDAIAEVRDVPDRASDENIFIADENGADDPYGLRGHAATVAWAQGCAIADRQTSSKRAA